MRGGCPAQNRTNKRLTTGPKPYPAGPGGLSAGKTVGHFRLDHTPADRGENPLHGAATAGAAISLSDNRQNPHRYPAVLGRTAIFPAKLRPGTAHQWTGTKRSGDEVYPFIGTLLCGLPAGLSRRPPGKGHVIMPSSPRKNVQKSTRSFKLPVPASAARSQWSRFGDCWRLESEP